MKVKRKRPCGRGLSLYILMYGLIYISLLLICSSRMKDSYIREISRSYTPEQFTAEEIAGNIEQAGEMKTEADVAVPDAGAVLANMKDIDRKNVIGGIYSKEAELRLPIFNGVTKANLLAGAGTMKAGQQMGSGNYCLAGHHMKDPDLLFGPLTKINIGNYIYLTDKSNVYTYEVVEKTVVHERQTGILEDGEEPLLTLITCNVSGVNTDYRLVIRGTLLDISSLAEDGNEIGQARYLKAYKAILNAEEPWSATLSVWLLGLAGAAFVILWISKKIIEGGT